MQLLQLQGLFKQALLTFLLHALLCAMQLPLGSVYKEPGYFGSTTAFGKSSPVTINATLPGTLLPLSAAICCSWHKQSFYEPPFDTAKAVLSGMWCTCNNMPAVLMACCSHSHSCCWQPTTVIAYLPDMSL